MRTALWAFLLAGIGLPLAAISTFLMVFAAVYPEIIAEFQSTMSRLEKNTVIYDRSGQPFTIIDGSEDRLIVKREEINRFMQISILAAEDARFFEHHGIDFWRLLGALWVNLRAGSYLQGGSSITQQLIKITLLSPEKTFVRKFREAFMALALEVRYGKLKILEHYMNLIYLGHGNYGVAQAALAYFQTTPQQLTLAQASFLAGLIHQPENYLRLPRQFDYKQNPFFPPASLASAQKRQQRILLQLLNLGWIRSSDYQAALAEPLRVKIPRHHDKAPYFVQHVRSLLLEEHQLTHITTSGYKIYTTLDPSLQSLAEATLNEAFQHEDRRFQQAALVALEPHTGLVRALVGGKDFEASEFNRSTQAWRQPGSAFKTILYATALEKGWHPNSVFRDEPISLSSPSGPYTPRNYDRRYGSQRRLIGDHQEAYYTDHYTLAKAFQLSLNTIAVKLLQKVGLPAVIEKAEALGLPIGGEVGLPLALGTQEVRLLDFTAAYTPFMNQGFYSPPVFILKIEDYRGKIIYEYQPSKPKEPVFSAGTVHQMNMLLRGVILRGTGTKANWKNNSHFIAGKTGTTSESKDAWFMGFSPELVTGVWIGNDDNHPMKGETGGQTPAMLWGQFMQKALPLIPTREPPAPPPEYRLFPTCVVSGKLATHSCPEVAYYPYPSGKIPQELCEEHPGEPLPENQAWLESQFPPSSSEEAPEVSPPEESESSSSPVLEFRQNLEQTFR